jgi:hypothetical protein
VSLNFKREKENMKMKIKKKRQTSPQKSRLYILIYLNIISVVHQLLNEKVANFLSVTGAYRKIVKFDEISQQNDSRMEHKVSVICLRK